MLVLSPTRELATQIAESFATYGRHTGLRQAVIYGGVSQNPQAKAVRDGVDILVATPGRLLDLMHQGLVTLDGIEILVLDEADRMLDMGFIRDIRKIVAKLPDQAADAAVFGHHARRHSPTGRQHPVAIRCACRSRPRAPRPTRSSSRCTSSTKRNKPALLKHLIERFAMTRTLVFTRTKHGADNVARHLSRAGIRAEAIHGNKTQNARQRALANFKSNKPPVLVATDVAARGLDIDDVSHVVNYDLPNVPETYVHRIGRTGRAGASGIAVSFCDHDEREHLREIEKLLRKKTPVCDDHPVYEACATGLGRSEVTRAKQATCRVAAQAARVRSSGWATTLAAPQIQQGHASHGYAVETRPNLRLLRRRRLSPRHPLAIRPCGRPRGHESHLILQR